MLPLELFFASSFKWRRSAEPFIDDNCQSILVTRCTWLSLKLLRCHIMRCSDPMFPHMKASCGHCDTKITKHYSFVSVQQYVGRFYIKVKYPLVMGILKCRSDLLNMRKNLIWHVHS